MTYCLGMLLDAFPDAKVLLSVRPPESWLRSFKSTIREVMIRAIPEGAGLYTMVRYEYEVGGTPYRGYMQQPGEMARYWSASDSVPVLYDPEDPSRSCIVYR